MTKLEYLKQLEAGLREKMTEQEIYDIMRDYAEYFEEGKTEGKTEAEIINSLGSPSYVVSQILNEQENPELLKPDDDIVGVAVGAAKEKFKRIKIRMEENKRYNQQKKREKQNYQDNVNYSGEYQSHNQPRPKRQKSETGVFKSVILIVLWIFFFAPFLMFVFSMGIGLVGAGVAGVCGLSIVSSFVLPVSNIVGILGILTLLCGGFTVLLLGAILFRFLIRKTFSDEREQSQPVFASQQEEQQQSPSYEENIKQEDDQNA